MSRATPLTTFGVLSKSNGWSDFDEFFFKSPQLNYLSQTCDQKKSKNYIFHIIWKKLIFDPFFSIFSKFGPKISVFGQTVNFSAKSWMITPRKTKNKRQLRLYIFFRNRYFRLFLTILDSIFCKTTRFFNFDIL